MKLEINLEKKYLVYLIISVAAVAGISYAIAQTPNPGHDVNEIIFPSDFPLVPPMAVMAFNGSSCPAGWAECDGSQGTTDLRGMFIRGWDHGAGVDPAREVGSFQDDELESHDHTYTRYGQLTTAYGNPAASTWLGVTTSTTSATGGSETRPKNVALIYCMKL